MRSLRDSSSTINEMIDWEIWEGRMLGNRPDMKKYFIYLGNKKCVIVLDPDEVLYFRVGNKKKDTIWKYLELRDKWNTFSPTISTHPQMILKTPIIKLRVTGKESSDKIREYIDRHFMGNQAYFEILDILGLGLQTDWVL